MKKVSLLMLVLILAASVAMAVTITRAPKIVKADGPAADPLSKGIVQVPSKTPSEQVFTGVHDFSCYMSMVRPVATDAAVGANFMILRSTDLFMYYVGTVDGGATWSTQGPLVPYSIRYPSAMADLVNNRPVAFYNGGWSDKTYEGAWTVWDEGNYNDGLWSTTPENIDTTGRKLSSTAFYCVQGIAGTSGDYNCVANYWGDFTPDAAFRYRSVDYGNTWPLSDPRCVSNLFFYDNFGTEDSNNLYKTFPVRHDPFVEGYINQLAITASADGQTVAIFSGGMSPDSVTGEFYMFYWKSTDGGATWSDLTYMPIVQDTALGWGGEIYEVGAAIDKDGYLHIATHLRMDMIADSSDYGPLTGIYDMYETSTGYGYSFVTGATDSVAGVSLCPGFCNFAISAEGDLILSFAGDGNCVADPNDIYVTRSTDNGRTWGKPLKITDGSQLCMYPHVPVFVGDRSSQMPVYYQVANDGYIHWVTVGDIPDGVEGAPEARYIHNFALNKSFPNPANGPTTFSFMLPRDSKYSLKVYNIAGQVVKAFEGNGTAGYNSLPWNTKEVANGVYLFKLNAAGQTATQKMVVIK